MEIYIACTNVNFGYLTLLECEQTMIDISSICIYILAVELGTIVASIGQPPSEQPHKPINLRLVKDKM